MRKLKRPDGVLFEEHKTYTAHVFEDGNLSFRDNDPSEGEYTGRFCFVFDGKTSPWYTRKTAPKWLLALYEEATTIELESWK